MARVTAMTPPPSAYMMGNADSEKTGRKEDPHPTSPSKNVLKTTSDKSCCKRNLCALKKYGEEEIR